MSELRLQVSYFVKPGLRDEFYEKIQGIDMMQKSMAEEGCIEYRYEIPEQKDCLMLYEIWVDEETQKKHLQTAHYQQLAKLKEEYVLETKIERS